MPIFAFFQSSVAFQCCETTAATSHLHTTSNHHMAFLRVSFLTVTTVDHAMCVEMANCSLPLRCM